VWEAKCRENDDEKAQKEKKKIKTKLDGKSKK